jgi:hypothetical protein
LVQPYGGWDIGKLNALADRLRVERGLPTVRDLNPDIDKMLSHVEGNKEAVRSALLPQTSISEDEVERVREACAKIADVWAEQDHDHRKRTAGEEIAIAIRVADLGEGRK